MAQEHLLYKFRAINKNTVESLVNPSLYFAKPDSLNDPFDCRVDLKKCFESAARLASPSQAKLLRTALNKPSFFKDWENSFNKIGVCSFSWTGDWGMKERSQLLWSHYADEHRGIRLLYRLPSSYLHSLPGFLGVTSVEYGSAVITEWLKSTEIVLDRPQKFLDDLMKIYIAAKAGDWDYEKEHRIVFRDSGVQKIPYGSLVEVCFGLRTPQTDIDLITKLAKEYSGCDSFKKMEHGASDFELQAVDL